MKAAPLKSVLVLLLVLMAFSAVLPACKGKQAGEEAVRAVIKDMAESAGKKDVSGVMKHIDREYKDAEGNNYDAIKGVLTMYFVQLESINVFLRKQHIEVKGDKAAAVVNAVVSRGRKVQDVKDLLPTEAGGFVFDLSFENKDGNWVVTSALWRQVGVAQAL